MIRWLLPDYVSDVLPAQARQLERVRRTILDRFSTYGYELVQPPLMEYLEGLLSGAERDLDEFTLRCVDPMSGRSIGLRADITPQAARIDAHLLNRRGVTRLCYCGSVLLSRPRDLLSTREPLLIGAELYGHAGIEADLEVVELMLDSLGAVVNMSLRLDLTHVGILRALLAGVQLTSADAEILFGLLNTKDNPSIEAFTQRFDAPLAQALQKLPRLYGDASVVEQARALLPQLPALQTSLDELALLLQRLAHQGADHLRISVDLADVRGYRYHTGIMFAVYTDTWANALVRGGRYDNVGLAFGRARAATGFSLDLRALSNLLPDSSPTSAIRAPWSNDPQLRRAVLELRNQGHIVVQGPSEPEQEQEAFICDRMLVLREGVWQLQSLHG